MHKVRCECPLPIIELRLYSQSVNLVFSFKSRRTGGSKAHQSNFMLIKGMNILKSSKTGLK